MEKWQRRNPPGTPLGELPDDWLCPECEVGAESFEPLD
jgi:rubredoxin